MENDQAENIIQRWDGEETFFYVDPPYPISTRKNSDGYGFDMTDPDHERLAKILHAARGMVMISGYACELYDKILYADWIRIETKAWADRGQERVEVVWLNKAAEQGRSRDLFSPE